MLLQKQGMLILSLYYSLKQEELVSLTGETFFFLIQRLKVYQNFLAKSLGSLSD